MTDEEIYHMCHGCSNWYADTAGGSTTGFCAACAPPDEFEWIRRTFGEDFEEPESADG